MDLKDSPHVEHVVPKSTHPDLRLSWGNMLLACGACNRAKSAHSYQSHIHYMPDFHNTQLAFDYVIIPHPTRRKQMACIPVPGNNDIVNVEKAKRTIDLFKLDAISSNPRATDLRWKYRFEAYQSSRLWRDHWNYFGKDIPDKFIPLLIDCAIGKGFFSIWFDCFQDEPDVKKALIDAFPGTRIECFPDSNDYNPSPLHDDDL